MLVRNLQGGAGRARRRGGAIGDGPDRDRARARTRRADEVRERLRRVFGIANFSYAGRGPHDFDGAGRGDPRATSAIGSPRRSASRPRASDKRLAVHVAADRARSRRADQGSRRAGASISTRPALTIHIEMLPDDAFYFFGKEPGAGGLPTGTGGRRGVPAVRRHRLAGRGVPHDAARLLGAADSFSQLSDPVARVAGEGARDRRAADEVPAAIAAGARAVRRAAAAGRARRAARAPRRDLSAADAADRRAARAASGTRARW